MLQCLGSLGLGNVTLDARNEVFQNVFLEGTQLRRPLYSGRRNRSTLRNTLFFLSKKRHAAKGRGGGTGRERCQQQLSRASCKKANFREDPKHTSVELTACKKIY